MKIKQTKSSQIILSKGANFQKSESFLKEILLSDASNHFFYFSLAKLVPVGYGIKKLQIAAVIEDEKVRLLILKGYF